MVKNLPTMWETQVQSLGQEDTLEKEMATHFSILAWEIQQTEKPGGLYSSRGWKESDTTERITLLHYYKTFNLAQQHTHGIDAWERGKDQKQISENYSHGGESHH